MDEGSTTHSRRDFMKVTAAAGTLAAAGLRAPGVHAAGSDEIRVGLIGCGGRGTGAVANVMDSAKGVRLIAVGDAFADRVEGARKRWTDLDKGIAVSDDNCFVGLDAFEKVIASDVNYIIIATPPAFRPAHLKAAVAAGKNIFTEKPVAVDAPGIRQVLAVAEEAENKGLGIGAGTQRRHQQGYIEVMKRVHDGAIGDLVSARAYWNQGGLWNKGRERGWSDLEWQIRNWLYFTWLAGDHIAEQHIHSLDKLAWVMGDRYPEKCVSSGGRIVRVGEEYGNVYDHFNTVFTWGGDLPGFSSCRQWNNAKTEVSDWVYGTRGRANIQRHSIEAGPWKWRYESDEPDDMYQNEHDELFASIREHEPINNGEYMCKSTMMAIMARMSAYTGKTITRKQALESKLDLTPAKYEWGDHKANPIARPGITKFV